MPAPPPSTLVRVALFVTCVNDTLYPETGRAVVRLLERRRRGVYEQTSNPVGGSLALSALFAALPLITLFVLLGGLRWAARKAGLDRRPTASTKERSGAPWRPIACAVSVPMERKARKAIRPRALRSRTWP